MCTSVLDTPFCSISHLVYLFTNTQCLNKLNMNCLLKLIKEDTSIPSSSSIQGEKKSRIADRVSHKKKMMYCCKNEKKAFSDTIYNWLALIQNQREI